MIKGRVFARLPFIASVASPESETSSLDHFELVRGAGRRLTMAGFGLREL